MEYTLTKEEIPELHGGELLQYLYSVECDIHGIEFELKYNNIVDGSAIYQDMVTELKELKQLHEHLEDEFMIRKERE